MTNRQSQRRRPPLSAPNVPVPPSLRISSYTEGGITNRGHVECLTDAVEILRSFRVAFYNVDEHQNGGSTLERPTKNNVNTETRTTQNLVEERRDSQPERHRCHTWPPDNPGHPLYMSYLDNDTSDAPEWSPGFASRISLSVEAKDGCRTIRNDFEVGEFQPWFNANKCVNHDDSRYFLQIKRGISSKPSNLTRDKVVFSDQVLGTGSFNKVIRVNIHKRPYALKHVKKDLIAPTSSSTIHSKSEDNSIASFTEAASRLSREVYHLSKIQHPNIVELKGWSTGKEAAYAIGRRHDSFFLIFELLREETLHDLIEGWVRDRNSNDHKRHEAEKLSVCMQMADALEYLHSKNIAYVNLKPANIGIATSTSGHDIKSIIRIKLFDFGAATTIPEDGKEANGISVKARKALFQSSCWYTSPEVFLSQSFGLECDIFSWGISFYEILSASRAYEDSMTPIDYEALVCKQNYRPTTVSRTNTTVPLTLPPEYLALLDQCWKAEPSERISLSLIKINLKAFLESIT